MDILRVFSLTVRRSKTVFYRRALEKRAEFIFNNRGSGSYIAELSAISVRFDLYDDEDTIIICDQSSQPPNMWWKDRIKNLEERLASLGFPKPDIERHCSCDMLAISLESLTDKEKEERYVGVIRWLLENDAQLDFQYGRDVYALIHINPKCIEGELPSRLDWVLAQRRFKKDEN